MGTAGRSAPLRRTGSLLGLLGLELAAVLALHWLGRFAGLRIGWDGPVDWLLSSPVQEVLGAVLRTVGLVMAYWLLASTVLYLLASLTRLPAAVRAVSWATLPLARRVADHAVAVTLATSMVGGGTLGVAGPALAADGRSGLGPPARKPVAAAQATSTTAAQDPPPTSAGEATEPSAPAYVPEPADQAPTSSTEETAPPPTPTEPAEPSGPAYTPNPAGQEPRSLPVRLGLHHDHHSHRRPRPPPLLQRPRPPPLRRPPPPPRPRPPPQPRRPLPRPPPRPAPPPPRPAPPPGCATARLRLQPGDHDHPGSREREPANDPGSGGPKEPNEPGADEPAPEVTEETSREVVVEGDSIWTIAENHLAEGSGEPTNQEVAEYVDQVTEANRDRLQSGDPDLIEPGETIILPPVARAEPAPEADRNTHDVAEGQTLWTIARDRLARASGGGSGEPTNREVTEYWAKVVEANQGRSGVRRPRPDLPGGGDHPPAGRLSVRSRACPGPSRAASGRRRPGRPGARRPS